MTSPMATPNRLIHEGSPYLRQHANNPVDWYPWGKEALQRAKEEDKPIFLSIGYAACHWCHVMERESFEDHEIADLLNRHFICIKVDREERPDLDQLYMSAVVALTRRGGWPMSVFLTPDAKPFFGGTYFPPDDRYGMPSFRRLLQSLISAWQQRKGDVLKSSDEITQHLSDTANLSSNGSDLGLEAMRQAVQAWARAFDPVHGGFGQAPKFPHPIEIQLLLRMARRSGDQPSHHMALHSLTHMALGGIYDQLRGGFHRYSTDAKWLVPHFEKMLYDNALLVQSYLLGYRLTGSSTYQRVIQDTLQWVLEEMTSPSGAFYSTLDADSEGVEGKFYIWSKAEVASVLGKDADWFCELMNITEDGQWEGHNILHRQKTDDDIVHQNGLSEEAFRERWKRCREELLDRRSQRTRPGRDEKIITAWNGMMIKALAQAGLLMGSQYVAAAERAALDVLKRLRSPDGFLYRSCLEEHPPKQLGFLDDYAFLIDALVALHEATGSWHWLEEARQLMEKLLLEFSDDQQGGFFFTGRSQETLILRGKETHDDATPAGVSMTVTVLLKLAKVSDRPDWENKARDTMRLYSDTVTRYPTSMSQLLCALDFQIGPVQEWVFMGSHEDSEVQEMKRCVAKHGDYNQIMLGPCTQKDVNRFADQYPLLKGKTAIHGSATAYLCQGGTCEAPMVGLEAVRKRLHAQP